jgi:hypothetical protein
MTLVTDVLARAARECSVEPPSSWLSSTEVEHVELRDDFLLETVEDILDRASLPSPIGKQVVITGDGSETYDLPADFRRLASDGMAVYETTTVQAPCIPIHSDGDWTRLKTEAFAGIDRYYRLSGYEGANAISFYREPTSGISITVSYVANLWMAAGGTPGNAFTDSEDIILFPRRLVEAGIVWRFRLRNGLGYEDKRLSYEAMLSRLNTDMNGRRSFSTTSRKRRHPWLSDVPNFIPSA